MIEEQFSFQNPGAFLLYAEEKTQLFLVFSDLRSVFAKLILVGSLLCPID